MPFSSCAGGALGGGVDLVGVGDLAWPATNLRSTTETLGVGTRMALPSSLPSKLGQDQPHRLGGAGRGRDHRHGSGAGAVEVLMHGVERRLVARIGVDGRHIAFFDAKTVMHHLGHRREAVRRAGCVGDDLVVGASALSWLTP